MFAQISKQTLQTSPPQTSARITSVGVQALVDHVAGMNKGRPTWSLLNTWNNLDLALRFGFPVYEDWRAWCLELTDDERERLIIAIDEQDNRIGSIQ